MVWAAIAMLGKAFPAVLGIQTDGSSAEQLDDYLPAGVGVHAY